MPEVVDRSIETLSEEDCVSLLTAHHFGRLGVVSDGSPLIFPVNYLFDQGRIAVRTDPGTKLTAGNLAKVSFEIDAVDDGARTGWSVLVLGTAYDVTDSIDEISSNIRRFPVDTWAPGARTRWIRIEPTSISGRRIVDSGS
jgi:nitroimidazol reductase NimA-like FMN-containing flavoprotein (pyridoxamine 5'-phosphate oxidase superfamily)